MIGQRDKLSFYFDAACMPYCTAGYGYPCAFGFCCVARRGPTFPFLSKESTVTLIYTSIIYNLDYCKSYLKGISFDQFLCLLRMKDSAARLNLKRLKRQHFQLLLKQLYWLPTFFRVTYEICVLSFVTLKIHFLCIYLIIFVSTSLLAIIDLP